MRNVFTTNWGDWGDLPPPENTKVEDMVGATAFRFKAWMREDTYEPWILMTDYFSARLPKYARLDIFGFQFLIDTWARTSKGSNGEPNGPNGGTQCPTI
tara:strand:- start:6242 stop:6538 length:297 start_codon:yes stop_codon:yes gene_type:complete